MALADSDSYRLLLANYVGVVRQRFADALANGGEYDAGVAWGLGVALDILKQDCAAFGIHEAEIG